MIIEVNNLVKNYGDVQAVKNISFSVKEGSLFSFLGVNGAGKSTTIGMLTSLLSKDKGQIKIGGFDIDTNSDQVRRLLGVVFQDSVLDYNLTVYDNLMIRGSLYDLSGRTLKNAVLKVIELTNINELKKRKLSNLSGGQRRRVDIARALIHNPKLLFLDEPTTGLDPKTRRDIWELIANLQKEKGMTVFLTTHYMEEAANSDDIVIIHKGEIKERGKPIDLKMRYATDLLKLTFIDGSYQEIKLSKTTDALEIAKKHEGKIENIEIINGTLDDVFINLTEEFNNAC